MNNLDSTTKKLIRDPIKRRAWVKYQVHLQGRSMAQIAKSVGVSRTAVYQTFFRPYPRMEKVIAEAIGLTPQALFPERYDSDGLPNRMMGRPRKSAVTRKQNSTPVDRRNVQTGTGS